MSNLVDLQIPQPDQAQFRAAEAALADARSYVITSADTCEAAAEDLRDIKAKQKELEAKRTAITVPLNKSLKAVNDLFRQPAEYLSLAETVLKKAILVYQQDQERKRLAEESRLRELARIEQEKLEAQAAKAEAKGKVERAETLREQAAAIPSAFVVAPVDPKIAGLSTRDCWHGEVIDKAELIRAAVDRPDLAALLVVDTGKLNQMARALKDALNVPGCRAVNEPGIASRAAC